MNLHPDKALKLAYKTSPNKNLNSITIIKQQKKTNWNSYKVFFLRNLKRSENVFVA